MSESTVVFPGYSCSNFELIEAGTHPNYPCHATVDCEMEANLTKVLDSYLSKQDQSLFNTS